ncbi:hypothetical protein OHX11_14185 [Acinetobacter baumannii]|nr:hypothetical protein [Acinetobacter baumannii]
MDISMDYFKKNIFPKIKENYTVTFSNATEGEVMGFGNLERVEIEGNNILGGIEFWSSGWLSIHLINIERDEEILNSLISPDDSKRKNELLEDFEKKLIEFK